MSRRQPERTPTEPHLPRHPLKDINTIFHGLSSWIHQTTQAHPPKYGSVHPLDTLLTATYAEQTFHIGWF